MLYMKHIALFLLFLVGWMCVSCSEEKEQVVMPALVETSPADGAEEVDFNLAEITLTFNEAMQTETSDFSQILLKPDGELKNIRFDGEKVILEVAGLAPGTRYTLQIPQGVLVDEFKNSVEVKISFTTQSSSTDYAPDMTGVEHDAFALFKNIKVGWNLGNSLESYNEGLSDHMDAETSWGNPKVTKEMIDAVKKAGFNAVRIPVRWYPHVTDQSTMSEVRFDWLNRVKEVVDYCIDNDMYVILNTHHEDWLESHPLRAEAEQVLNKERNLWRSIAMYFRDYDEHLIFSGTNEVEINWQAPTVENLEVQNSFNQCFVDAVRTTGGKNYYRNLIIQTYATNPDYAFDGLNFPTDVVENRIAIEFHFYRPAGYSYMDFADYTESVYFWGKDFIQYNTGVSNEQEDYVDGLFGKIKQSWVDKGYPVVMGEYGAVTTVNSSIGHETEQIASRAYYMEYVTRAARANGIVPVVWDNGSFNTVPDFTNEYFGLFDRNNGMATNEVSKAMLEGIMKGCDTEYPF
jgi:endoglucanase